GYYPKSGEDLHAAVKREVLAVRQGVGTLDASTLGKIDIQGPDAATLLNWVYTNPWSKLEVGKCRYGLMLDENGMVFDDGVTVRLADRSEEHTSELQSRSDIVCRLPLEKKNHTDNNAYNNNST